jgi:CHAT domain-containing protein
MSKKQPALSQSKSRELGILVSLSLCFAILLFGCVATGPMTRTQQLIDTQQYKDALAGIRSDIAGSGSASPVLQAQLRLYGIKAIIAYSWYYGKIDDFDKEAQRYFDEGVRLAGVNQILIGELNHEMATYYGKSFRLGTGIEYIRRAIDILEAQNDRFRLARSYELLGSFYEAKGLKRMRDECREKALSLAKDYFNRPSGPDERRYWLEYSNMLIGRMIDHGLDGAPEKIYPLWRTLEPLALKYLTPVSPSYLYAAKALAAAGDVDGARRIFELGKHHAQRSSRRGMDMDVIGTELQIALAAKNYSSAVAHYKQWIARKRRLKFKGHPADNFWGGQAYEGAGDLESASQLYQKYIKELESGRLSMAVNERTHFFSGWYRKAYYGLIRCRAKEYLENPSKANFDRLLKASELIRARQFGELTGELSANDLSSALLDRMRSELAADEAVLGCLTMDDYILVYGITPTDQAARLVPYKRKKFNEQMRHLIKELSNPESRLQSISGKTQVIQDLVLERLEYVIEGMRRIVFLPDGMLGAVPLEVISTSRDEYKPLALEKTVSYSPSLAYLLRKRSAKQRYAEDGFLALANPRYGSGDQKQIGNGGPLSQMEISARGGRFLQYFVPLPETQDEVVEITRRLDEQRVKILTGADASETVLQDLDLSGYRVIHIATHGILGDEVPGVEEPALVLADDPDSDGFLKASEVQNLKLNAAMTALSACNTGAGQYVTGEGIMGMSRSFLLAGSGSVVVSLWPVASMETVQLMVSFYQGMSMNMETPDALQRAKIEMMRGNHQRLVSAGVDAPAADAVNGDPHPFFWAPFIIIGH